ncbi:MULTISPECIES: xanthine dehydrogenase family protein molybdopterin-binding subunit [Amycolatopsis]|uniref:Xanthine dehydrogenase family protein molybdopterin-binding subunit n=1 Tax=Amycolatopsis albidoflavus TaxID=102226 RepID=A0ABW5HS67_9PSEU
MATTYVGTSPPRREDDGLLTGSARFVGDLNLPGMAFAAVVRSPIAHGRLLKCDTSAAAASPGVLTVLTPAEAAGARLPCVALMPGQASTSYPVLDEVVRYVGQPLAVVVAESEAEAFDAVALVALDFEQFPAVVDVREALEPDSPLLHPDWGTNLVSDCEIGDSARDCDEMMEAAFAVVDMTFLLGRVAPCPMEPRGVVARWENGEVTLWISTQAAHQARDHLAGAVGLSHRQVRVIAPRVGGAFGAKEHLYPDEVAVCLAARKLARPVRWTESRGEHFVATLAARDVGYHGRLAVDRSGRFLALHCDIVGNLGAHPSNVGGSPLLVGASVLPGPYRFGRAGARVRGVVTTTTPTGSYRGFGQPEASWARERLIDEAARLLHADPVELRIQNMVKPADFPYRNQAGEVYDSGDYPHALRMLRDRVAARESKDDNRRRAVGYACHVLSTGMGPSESFKDIGWQAGGFETAIVRMEPDASVVVHVGVNAFGQGIETALAQIAADELSVPLSRVQVKMGDTDTAPYSSIGSIASRSAVLAGGALIQAAAKLRAKMIAIAAHQLEACPEDFEFRDEKVQVRGDRSSCLSFAKIASDAWRGWDLPPGAGPGLEERVTFDPAGYTFSYGAHAAAVAIDPDTGVIDLEGYWIVNDSGSVINPAIVEGQLRGGAVQGIGMTLTENFPYDGSGQPLTTQLSLYGVSGIRTIPDIDVTMLTIPCPFTPGGMKGVGEAGIISAPAAVGNAVAAALPEVAGQITDAPIRPSTLWALLDRQSANSASDR